MAEDKNIVEVEEVKPDNKDKEIKDGVGDLMEKILNNSEEMIVGMVTEIVSEMWVPKKKRQKHVEALSRVIVNELFKKICLQGKIKVVTPIKELGEKAGE